MRVPKLISVNVTQEDIDTGLKQDCNRCPIALALARKPTDFVKSFPVHDRDVCTESTYLGVHKYKLPPEARKFVRRFDNDKSVKPFKFKLEFKETISSLLH